MKIRSIYFSNGNRYIGGILEVYIDCLQIIRKRLFSLKNTNLNPNLGSVGGPGVILPPVAFPLITQK